MHTTKKILFRFSLLFIPLLFFLFIEIILRLFNLFPIEPLFIEKTQNGIPYVRINPDVGRRYFNPKEITTPRLYPQSFTYVKPDNSLRVFCLGGSTTAGFPYDMTVPFPQQLQFLLQKIYKDRQVEVINLGLSAINSYTVLDWLPDIIEQQPDLVLIYMGHNEFYGAYGSASTISIGQNGTLIRLYLKLQHLHIVGMLKSFLNLFAPDKITSDETLMKQVIADPLIEQNSATFQNTLTNYSENLLKITEDLRDEEIPVILSNLVSNLKDQPPMESLIHKQPGSQADAFYNQALQINDTDSLYTLLIKAKDADRLRFRAPSRFNTILKSVADKTETAFVDMETIFRDNSPAGLPGENLFCDHLHPNPDGYYLMAGAFFQSIRKLPQFNDNAINRFPQKPAYVTALDWEMGSVRLYRLKQQWPFAEKNSDYKDYEPFADANTAQIAYDFVYQHFNWVKAHFEMADYYKDSPYTEKACAEYLAVNAMYPERPEPLLKLIDCYEQLQDWIAMEKACSAALNTRSEKGKIYYKMALAQYNSGRIKEALNTVQHAIIAPENSPDQRSKSELLLARFLVGIRKINDAEKVLKNLLKANPDFKPATDLLNNIFDGR